MDLTFQGAEHVRPEEARDEAASAPSGGSVSAPGLGRGWRAVVVAVLVVGTVVRFVARSHLWLDEAQSLNIARLPLGDIPRALRHDGAPPLYYVLLHGWARLFGTGTVAVRALSGVFSVAVLPLIWLAARRLSGSRAAWAATILLASNPFAIRYSTEVRMYSLIMVLALAGLLAAYRLLEGGSLRHQVVLGLATGLSVLTHYWALYLSAVAVALLAHVAQRGTDPARTGARRALTAMAAGGLLFLPWVPSFLYQLSHTGTPWGRPGQFRSVFDTVTDFAGGYRDPGIALSLLYSGLLVLGVFGWAVDNRRIVLELRPRMPGGAVAALVFGTLVLAVVTGCLTGSAFAVRYAASLFPLVLLVVALGTDVFADPRLHRSVLAVAVALGFWGSVPNIARERTTAARVAASIDAHAWPGDVVAYCPDQMGPSVSRELQAAGLVQVSFPRASPPELVDWVDYAKVNRTAETRRFGEMLLQRAGRNDIWLVWAPGYRTFGTKCQRLLDWLDEARPGNRTMVAVSSKYFEHPGLVRYRAEPRPVG